MPAAPRLRRILFLLTLALVAALPYATSRLLVRRDFDVSLADFRPYISDETYYWHQIHTFQQVGFRGGYYTLEEHPAPAGAIHFGFHGPVFPVLYGSVARVTGWYRDTGVYYNAVVIAAAIVAAALLAEPGVPRLLLFGASVLTYWPVVFWLPTMFQESLNHAGAILLAGIFVSVGRTRRPLTIGAGWALLVILGLLRPSWLFLLPAWAAWTAPRNLVRLAGHAVVGLMVAVLVFIAFVRTSAPYAGSPLTDMGSSPVQRLLSLGRQITRNIVEINSLDGLARQHFVAFLAVLGAVWMAWLAILIAWRRRGWSAEREENVRHGALHAFNLLTIVVGVFALYASSEHRILAPAVLFTSAALSLTPRRFTCALAAWIVAVNLAMLPVALVAFQNYREPNFVWDRRPGRVFAEAIEHRITYRADTTNPWCNTLLVSQYPPELIEVPAGIGISSTLSPDELSIPPRSAYLLLDDESVKQMTSPFRMEKFGSLPYGNLYINLDSGCAH